MYFFRFGRLWKRHGRWAENPNGTNYCKHLKKKTAGISHSRRYAQKSRIESFEDRLLVDSPKGGYSFINPLA